MMELNWVTIFFTIPIVMAILMGIGNSLGFVNLDHDFDIGHDIDHDIEHGHEASAKDSFLDLFGIGRVPFSIILLTMNMLFGVIGLCFSMILEPIFKYSIIYGPLSIGIAFIGVVFFTGKICRGIGSFMPSNESYVRTAEDLIGKEGMAYTDIDAKFGIAQVRDNNKMLHKIICQSCDNTNIIDGTKIIVLEYNIDNKIYKVIALSELTKN